MNTIYVMIPLFQIDSKQHIESKTKSLLGLQSYQSYHNLTIHEISNHQYAVEIHNFKLNFLDINHLLEQFNQSKRKIQILQSVLKDYQYQNQSPEQSHTQNSDHIIKKMKKYKEIKQQNKKLKKLLQVQLENTQKVRQQTQKTMKVLRQEFDALVLEIGKKQKTPVHSTHQPSSNSFQVEHQTKQKTLILGTNGVKHTTIR